MPVPISISFHFYCRTSHKDKDGKSPIVLRISFRQCRKDINTGIYCPANDWDSVSKKVAGSNRDSASLKANLDTVLRQAHYAFDELRFSRKDFSIDDIADKLSGKDEKPQMLIDYLVEGNEKMKKRVGTEITKHFLINKKEKSKPCMNAGNRSELYGFKSNRIRQYKRL
ncbi:MAG TPA: Arm DNA-binding domain-containing protein [Puia sp.]|nr:Arm DNA-binding domain-containing protein [Puia sp.]